MSLFDDSIRRLAHPYLDTGVVGMYAYIDPSGQWWMAPLGSDPPNPDRPMPAAWTPIKRLDRSEVP